MKNGQWYEALTHNDETLVFKVIESYGSTGRTQVLMIGETDYCYLNPYVFEQLRPIDEPLSFEDKEFLLEYSNEFVYVRHAGFWWSLGSEVYTDEDVAEMIRNKEGKVY